MPRDLQARFRAHVAAPGFPCVGAKAAMAHGDLAIAGFGGLSRPDGDADLYRALCGFVRRYRERPEPFQGFVALFDGPDGLSEAAFEAALWARLQALSDIDAAAGGAYDPRVEADPADPRFSFSIAGEALFVVGLHPGASRPARRFETPALVFNPHQQFERLRADGRYGRLAERITARDVALAGSPNPMLAGFGEMSEARQYSGRRVGAGWACPFRFRGRRDDAA